MHVDNSLYKKQFLLLLLTAVLLWLVFDYTELDMYVSRLFYDDQSRSWPYRADFVIEMVGYVWIKYVLIAYGVMILFLLLYSYRKGKLAAKRKLLIFLLLAMIIVPSEIAFLKHTFHKPRPEQVVEFGGTMRHVKLSEFLYDEPSASNWPGGHASGGAALLSLYFASGRFWRKAGIGLGVIVSQMMGFVQIMRGQHFLSHNLWTLWFSWLTVLILYYLVFELSGRDLPVKYPCGDILTPQYVYCAKNIKKREILLCGLFTLLFLHFLQA